MNDYKGLVDFFHLIRSDRKINQLPINSFELTTDRLSKSHHENTRPKSLSFKTLAYDNPDNPDHSDARYTVEGNVHLFDPFGVTGYFRSSFDRDCNDCVERMVVHTWPEFGRVCLDYYLMR
jgi:hypothetical protein